jgi:glycyl-tRNA synthetase
MKTSLEDIVSLAKRRGFIYPSSEIYGGLSGVYDYGPLGVKIKHNLQNIWWESFVAAWDDMYPIDAAILMNQKVWQASGHTKTFTDPLEDGTKFNTMFKTSAGVGKEVDTIYLRPETAQGMFVNFKNLIDTFSPDMPFGMAQIGKGFRNEISPRDWLFRMREFDMMEIEYFTDPKDWEKHFESWREGMKTFFTKIGLPASSVHELEVPESDRAHYSQRTIDFEYDFPFGKAELAGLAYRGDYDLKKHQEASGKDLQYRPKDGSKPFLPHVIEPSFGLDRLVLAILSDAYSEDKQGGEKRTFLKLDASVAPVKVAVFPLLKNKPELVKKACEVYQMLKDELGSVEFDDNGNIGKRYRRQDEIGTPYCITVDFQTLEDNTVTLRNRDTTEQQRVKVEGSLQMLKFFKW